MSQFTFFQAELSAVYESANKAVKITPPIKDTRLVAHSEGAFL